MGYPRSKKRFTFAKGRIKIEEYIVFCYLYLPIYYMGFWFTISFNGMLLTITTRISLFGLL